MSRDIFVQDLPTGLLRLSDIPDGWEPQTLPCNPDSVRAAVHELAPEADFSDPSWWNVTLPGADIEVNLGSERPLGSFALHVRASDNQVAESFISRLLDRLGLRAMDPEGAQETGIFGSG